MDIYNHMNHEINNHSNLDGTDVFLTFPNNLNGLSASSEMITDRDNLSFSIAFSRFSSGSKKTLENNDLILKRSVKLLESAIKVKRARRQQVQSYPA